MDKFDAHCNVQVYETLAGEDNHEDDGDDGAAAVEGNVHLISSFQRRS
jgi:hypothetical protein